MRACVRVFVSGQWEKGQWSGAARKHSAICPCRKQFFLSFCIERHVAESRHPPVLGGNLSDFALPGRGSVGEGASPVPVVKRSLHSRPIKAGEKALPKAPNPREKLLFLLHPFTCGLILSPRRAIPGTGGSAEEQWQWLCRAMARETSTRVSQRWQESDTQRKSIDITVLSVAHTLSITRNLAI